MPTFRHRVLLVVLGMAFTMPLPVARGQTKSAVNPDSDCLTCHGQKDLKSDSGRSIFVDAAKHQASVHASLDCTTCHTDIKEFPHPKRIAKVNCASCHEEAPKDVAHSVHGLLGREACTSCHGIAHNIAPAAEVSPKQCATCHAEVVKDFRSSVHALAKKNGETQAPTCQTCHGTTHKILPVQDAASPVAKKNLPDTCGSCHSNPDFLARHQIPFAHPVEAYRLSVHGRAVAAGNAKAPSCSDCHASHGILAARDPHSKINHWNVPATCGSCHTEIAKTYAHSIHGKAVAQGVRDAPVCTDCHGEHTILAPREAQSLVNPARVSSVTCGRCHGDERLNARYNLPTDRVPTFADSFHGLAARSGEQTVANCASCHGVHNILPSSDPLSTVNPANLAHTCGACHAGAGERFSIGRVHVRSETSGEHVVVRWIRWIYWILIPLALGFMVFHHAVDFLRKLIRRAPRADSGEEVFRMGTNFRIAHWLVVVSFPVLVITGFALKFPEAWWARPVVHWESHFALRGAIHRTAGVVLIVALLYHIVHLAVSRRDRIILRYIRPRLRDLFDLGGMLRYNLGLSSKRPVFGKFTYAEKIEYLAFVWGTAVMAVSGLLLWFNNFTLQHFPKWVADAATVLHYYEAILATFSILIWHAYITVFDPDVYPMDRSWLTGRTSADHVRHNRPEYYEALKSMETKDRPSEGEKK
jgi:formate dehydrogenase gamma subunit